MIPEDWSKVFMRAEIWSENNEGKMKIDFAYDDLYELYDKFMSDEIREQWEEKYLK